MNNEIALVPDQASNIATEVDTLFFSLVAISAFFVVLIFALALYFVIRYRRRSETEQPRQIHGNIPLELIWTGIPLVISLFIFGWGAKVYFDMHTPPANAMEILVVAKQWMWKMQHPTGQREIDELHLPVGRPVRLTMTSEDVIHSFYVPAFRVKQDVLPGRYTSLWFTPTKTGAYHLFCAEYCGTNHSAMTGYVIVMEPAAYEAWLAGKTGESPEVAGRKLFDKLGCQTCHHADGTSRGPSLVGAFGRPTAIGGGATVSVDDEYIRESILEPRAKVVAGYEPVMPTFKGQVDEEGLLALIAYIKSLKAPASSGSASEATQ